PSETPAAGAHSGETQATPPGPSRPDHVRDEALAGADYSTWLVAIYLSGVVVMLARIVLGVRGGRPLWRPAGSVADPALLAKTAVLSKAVGLRRVPALAYCRGVAIPTVFGLLRSTILLPLSAASGLTVKELGAIVLHELVHLRRHDPWVNLLQR